MISVHPLILLYIVLKLALKTCKHHFRWAASFFSLFFSVSFRRWVLSLVCSFFPLFLLCVCFLFLFCWIPSAVWMTKSDLLVSSFLFDGTCRIPFTILWISICCSGTIICVGGFVSNKTGKRVCVCVCVYVCVCVSMCVFNMKLAYTQTLCSQDLDTFHQVYPISTKNKHLQCLLTQASIVAAVAAWAVVCGRLWRS